MTTTDDNGTRYQFALTEPPGYFLGGRRQWLADPDSVQACQNDQGGWEILLRIDGTYYNEETAQAFAAEYQQEVHGLAEQFRRDPLLVNGYEAKVRCPICGKESILCRRLDRYMHLDGTGNTDCWRAISRGERPTDLTKLQTHTKEN